MNRPFTYIFIAFFFLSVDVMAQMGKFYGADAQLSSSFTNQVYLDREGFIWIPTRNGLNRYDGYQFQLYNKERYPDMASNYINCITQDRHGLFYIGMYGAFQTYNGSTFADIKVKDLRNQVMPVYITCFVERQTGEMLAGTSGHGVIIVDSPTEAHQLNGDLREVETVNDMIEDQKGRLWIATSHNGVLVYDGHHVVKRYLNDAAHSSIVRRVCEDRNGVIYVGTFCDGLYRLAGNDISRVEGTEGKSITALYCNDTDKLMIGYDGAGVAILDTHTRQMTDNPYYSREVDLTKAKVVSITEDRGGNLWLGMFQKGIFMYPNTFAVFGYMGYKLGPLNSIGQACVLSTLIDSQGRWWVGTDKDGVYQLTPEGKLVRHYIDGVPSVVVTMAEDLQHRIWLGSYQEGCGWIDTNGSYHPLTQFEGKGISAFGFAFDRRGNTWIGTLGNGLMRFSADGQVKDYLATTHSDENRKENSIINDFISRISLSPDGRRIYVATSLGLSCLDIEKESWISVFDANCLLYGHSIRIAKEYGGRLWIGTNDGLYRYDLTSREMKRLGKEDGLSDNSVVSIEQDLKGLLWIGTEHGLNCHNPQTGQTESFFSDNGLQANEFGDGASAISAQGEMLFGGVGGITWFDPDKIEQNEWKAKVNITSFLINGSPVSSNTKSGHYLVCDTTVIACDRFDLSYNDNSFAIQLSTLTYHNSEHITYLYSINGEDYVRLQPGQNEITFSHLSPGTYHFVVKAERNNQQTAERAFTVVVHHPWWSTWWAYALYALILGAIVWYYLRIRNQQEQARLRLQEHIHAEEMGEAKLRFFMNMSHEIRTPMTLIVTPLLSLMKRDKDPERHSVYETIRRNAERILSLINQMMDLRKIDKGMMQMRMQETDLIGFVGELYSLFEHQARTKNINFTYTHADESLPVWIDRKQFDKVIVNILSNAFKFTPMGGAIHILVTQKDGQASISVSDNGEWIPEDKLDHIFERFYQTSSTVNDINTGTGIGLDLTRALVELHHGTIVARNLDLKQPETPEQTILHGVEFVVTIPLGEDHLTSEEIADDVAEEKLITAELIQDEEDAPPTPLVSGNGHPKIVVAEDDQEIRDFLYHELSQDFDVIACVNGREALAEALKKLPDLVLSDIMMPEMDGTTLCSTLKSNPQTNHIPVILLTAKNRDEDYLEGLETGADAYVTKPFNMDILRRTIVNLISTRQHLRLKYGRNDQLEEKVDKIEMKSPDEKLLERVMRVINQNISNSDLSVDSIASEVGISRVHVHRKMKELTGQTPHEFIRRIRLKQAAKLLSSGDNNVTEVMYACGFSNAASFSTIFKKYYGMSPREYTQENQK